MTKTDLAFLSLIWIGSLGFAFFFGHEFGLTVGARIERENQGYKFANVKKAFE